VPELKCGDALEEIATMPVTLPGCRKFLFSSCEAGGSYEIFTFVPDADPPTSGFPVIYVLDANAEFATVAETVRRVSLRPRATGIGPSVVVGIGYPQTSDYNMDRRNFDFTRSPASDAALSDRGPEDCGGQAAYIRFLGSELQPHIVRHLPVDQQRQTLLGHSLGGYFVLDLLVQHPGMFAGYIAFSPSVWWNRLELSRSLARLPARPLRPIRAYVTVGRWEEELAPWQAREDFSEEYFRLRAARRMIGNTREISAEIAAAFGDRASVKFEIGETDDHATVLTSRLCDALRFIMG